MSAELAFEKFYVMFGFKRVKWVCPNILHEICQKSDRYSPFLVHFVSRLAFVVIFAKEP